MKAHLGSLLGAHLALQGPVDPPVLATPATVFFHLCEPSRGVWAITKTAIRLWAQCCSHTAGEVGETHRWPLSFFHFTKTLRCCLGFVFLGLLLGLFWIQLKSLCNAVLLSYFPFFKFHILYCDVMHSLSTLMSFTTMKWLLSEKKHHLNYAFASLMGMSMHSSVRTQISCCADRRYISCFCVLARVCTSFCAFEEQISWANVLIVRGGVRK